MRQSIVNAKKNVVLIVDDSPETIDILRSILRGSYRIKAASSGRKAIEIACSENPPDLILLDIMMPEMDGYQTCRQLKEIPKTRNIPVIFLTAKTEEDDEITGFELGAVDYITKPISPRIVMARVKTHLELKSIRDTLEQEVQFVEQLSLTDPLTGFRNRRGFESDAQRYIDIAIRYNRPLSLLMLDIDHFKRVNDAYGHMTGDMVLVEIARCCRRTMRVSDSITRFGGEEFCFLLPETELESARLLAERLRTLISAITFEAGPQKFNITVSIGISGCTGEKDSLESLLARSDEALYRAKMTGRNQVVIYENLIQKI